MNEFQKMGIEWMCELRGKDFEKLFPESKLKELVRAKQKPSILELLVFLKGLDDKDEFDLRIVDIDRFLSYWKLQEEQFLPAGFNGLITMYYRKEPDVYYFNIDYGLMDEKVEKQDDKLWDSVEKVRPGSRLRSVFDKKELFNLKEQLNSRLDLLEDVFKDSYRLDNLQEVVYFAAMDGVQNYKAKTGN